MGCIVNNLTEEQIREDIFKTKTNIAPVENQTQEQSEAYLDSLRPIFTKVNVSADSLSKRTQKMLIIEKNELVERYAFKSDKVIALEQRNTDKTALKLKKRYGLDKALEINKVKDNKVKAEVGTKIHQAAQDIMEYLIEKDKTGLVKKNSENTNYNLVNKDLKTIRTELKVTQGEFDILVSGTTELFNQIKTIQKEVDPKSKVRIYTEQLVYNENEDWMGTSDLLFIFSDNSFGHADYKTISPSLGTTSYNVETGRNEIVDSNWLPYYKEEDLSIQLGAISKTLQHKFGLGKMRFSRGIPIHVEIGYDKKKPIGNKLTGEINKINIGEGDTKGRNKYLAQIPVGELTGIEELDKEITRLSNIKNNLEIRLDNMSPKDSRYEGLKTDINNKRRLINKIILNKDISFLQHEVKRLLNKYYKTFGKLNDIDNKFIGEKPNPNYLSTDELSLLIDEFKAYKQILDSSPHYMKELGVESDADFQKYIDSVGDLTLRLGSAITAMREVQTTRVMTKEEIMSLEDAVETGFLQTWFRPLSEQQNPALQKVSGWIQESYNSTRLETQKLHKESIEQVKEV
jgi:hypothetical protein